MTEGHCNRVSVADRLAHHRCSVQRRRVLPASYFDELIAAVCRRWTEDGQPKNELTPFSIDVCSLY
jgi:hypothetical protein